MIFPIISTEFDWLVWLLVLTILAGDFFPAEKAFIRLVTLIRVLFILFWIKYLINNCVRELRERHTGKEAKQSTL